MTADLFELWVYLAERPLLWLTVTVAVYWGAHRLYQLSGELAVLNPVLVAVAVLVGVLLASDTAYATYFDGAQFVHFLLGPATVALAVPLYGQAHRLRRMALPLALALVAGSVTAVVSAVGIGWLLGLGPEVLRSLMPKSVTTPVAMGISEKLGGLPALTAVLVILTGITGAVLAIPLLRLLGFGREDAHAKGFALGVAAHGIGTARAFQHSEEAGAFAGLGMGLNALLTALVAPLVVWLLVL
ncbi:MAG: LrgB family protein [Halofilum sp. (in: g-proteobacteria)]|nr:LrgB family protein [Halofilum sp. (in: g-proteobacteria)]